MLQSSSSLADVVQDCRRVIQAMTWSELLTKNENQLFSGSQKTKMGRGKDSNIYISNQGKTKGYAKIDTLINQSNYYFEHISNKSSNPI